MKPCPLTSTFFPELEASPSPPSGPGSRPSGLRKSPPTPAPSSPSDGPGSLITETCELFPELPATCSPGGSPASRFPKSGSGEAKRMTATSGRQCSTLYDDASPLGSLVRMCLESPRWNSSTVLLTWRSSAIASNRLLFRLVPSTPSTDGTESGLWPTLSANDWKGSAKSGQRRGQITDPAMGVIPPSGQLNPAWAEWYMGYPVGWTELLPSEIPSSRKSRKSSSKTSGS